MNKTILLSFLASSAPLFGTVFNGSVTGDTYIRNDGTPATNYNSDAANRMLVGSNGATDNLRALLKFDVASIINDVNSIGGGDFANLTINSASLQIFERVARTNALAVNVKVNAYGYSFDPATSTWNAPAVGDATAGGTVGTTLGSLAITWATAGNDNDVSTITLSTSDLKTHLTGHLSNSINLLLNTNTATQNFLSITSDLSTNTARHAKLTIDYTVTPSGGPELTLDPASPQPDFTFPYSQTTATPARTVRYKNTSASLPITVDAVSITNSSGGVFSLGTVSPALPATLAPGAVIDIPVTAASTAAGSFTGALLVDTNAAGQDKTPALNASFYQSGQLYSANPSMATNTTSWDGGSTWVKPGLTGFTGDGMARVRGNGDPLQPIVRSAHSQATAIPNNLPDWCLDFRFSPISPAAFAAYTGLPADGNFGDRTFQFVVQATDVTPAPGLTEALDDETLLNIAYFPDGITTGGTAGFYVFNQTAWELIDFNGDGSALILAGSIDVDTDANTSNGIGDGNLNATSGDTVNVYRMSVKGTGFGTPSATYTLTLTGPGGLNKTASGLTAWHGRNITSHLPASFAFITTDSSTASNATAGVCPSFWVDEVGYFAVDRPAQRLLLFNGPTTLRSLNGAMVTHALSALNDGTSSVDLSASLTGTSTTGIASPTTFPVTLAAGATQSVLLNYDPAGLTAPDTAATGSLTVTSNDPLLPAASYPFTVTKVTDANLVANGDFESATGTGTFPVGWTLTGTPTSITSFLPSGGGAAAVNLAPSQGMLQDIAPAAGDALDDFQTDFVFQIGNETQAHRIRMEGDGGGDLLTIRLTTSPTGTDFIDVFNAGTFIPALSGLTIVPNTPYHLRVIGRSFSQAGRRYTIGFSTDGVTYTTSAYMTAFHATAAAKFETATFECGATALSSLAIENVTVKVAPPDDLAAWMSGFTFASGADTSATGDADNDGISNLVENVLGTAPNVPTTGLAQIASASGNLSFQHPLNPELASDVTYTYEWSTDLIEWKASGLPNTGGVTVAISPAAPVAGVVTVTTSLTGGSTSRVFVRLVANQS